VIQEEFGEQLKEYAPRDKVREVHEEWEKLKKGMVKADEEVRGRNSKRKTKGDPMAERKNVRGNYEEEQSMESVVCGE
jgi:hypothetical protein